MAQQWVDITTINNQTPFMQVRWKGIFANNSDCWFAETPGLVTDGMSWTQGTSQYGWFSAHRMNRDSYSCSFNHSGSTFWDESGRVYRDHVKDAPRASYNDEYVTISGQTYYQVNFENWSGATGVQLYAPYSNMPWAPGDVYVLVGVSKITGNKNLVTFNATGGTNSTLEITAEDDWTATASDNWFTVSSLSGTSGTTAITITVSSYSGTTDRTGTIEFACGGDTFEVTVKQKKVPGQGTGFFLGDVEVVDMYLGDQHIDALYLGDIQIS